jgi:hypothetical protein
MGPGGAGVICGALVRCASGIELTLEVVCLFCSALSSGIELTLEVTGLSSAHSRP